MPVKKNTKKDAGGKTPKPRGKRRTPTEKKTAPKKVKKKKVAPKKTIKKNKEKKKKENFKRAV